MTRMEAFWRHSVRIKWLALKRTDPRPDKEQFSIFFMLKFSHYGILRTRIQKNQLSIHGPMIAFDSREIPGGIGCLEMNRYREFVNIFSP